MKVDGEDWLCKREAATTAESCVAMQNSSRVPCSPLCVVPLTSYAGSVNSTRVAFQCSHSKVTLGFVRTLPQNASKINLSNSCTAKICCLGISSGCACLCFHRHGTPPSPPLLSRRGSCLSICITYSQLRILKSLLSFRQSFQPIQLIHDLLPDRQALSWTWCCEMVPYQNVVFKAKVKALEFRFEPAWLIQVYCRL